MIEQTTIFNTDNINDLTDTLEQVLRPFLAGAVEYGDYSDDEADQVYDHAQYWIKLLREFVSSENGSSA